MTKRRRLSGWAKAGVALGSVVLVLAAVVGAGILVVTAPSPTWPGSAEHNRWYQADLGPDAMAADGSDYRVYAKTGSSDNLIIYFGGGGVTWDANSAVNPITVTKYLFGGGDTGTYFRSIPSYFPTTLGGILDANNPENPFTDWNVVMIPYATGDFHAGTGIQTLTADDGTVTEMHYNGQENVRLALEWIGKNMIDPDKLLIAGASAGSFGAAFHTPEIAQRYPDSQIYQFSEGDQLPSPKWPDVTDDLWDAHWEQTFGYAPGDNLYETAVVANRALLGDEIVFLDSNTTRDGTLIGFASLINDVPPDADAWSAAMRASMKRLSETVPNYYYFLTDDDPDENGFTSHTLSSLPVAYTTEQDGVRFLDWLADAVIRDRPISVGEGLLTAP